MTLGAKFLKIGQKKWPISSLLKLKITVLLSKMKYFTPFSSLNDCKLVFFWPIFKNFVPKVLFWFWKSDIVHLILYSCFKHFKNQSHKAKDTAFSTQFGVIFTTKIRKAAFSREDTHQIFSFGVFVTIIKKYGCHN